MPMLLGLHNLELQIGDVFPVLVRGRSFLLALNLKISRGEANRRFSGCELFDGNRGRGSHSRSQPFVSADPDPDTQWIALSFFQPEDEGIAGFGRGTSRVLKTISP